MISCLAESRFPIKRNSDFHTPDRRWISTRIIQYGLYSRFCAGRVGKKKKETLTVDVSLETFRKPLKLQGNVEEIKFSKLYAKGDFLQCVKESGKSVLPFLINLHILQFYRIIISHQYSRTCI